MMQNNYKKFRIYRYVDTRFQIFGLRLEQLGLLIVGFFAFALVDGLMWQLVTLGVTGFLFVASRRFSKLVETISFKSLLEWHLGVRSDLGSLYPASQYRIVVGD